MNRHFWYAEIASGPAAGRAVARFDKPSLRAAFIAESVGGYQWQPVPANSPVARGAALSAAMYGSDFALYADIQTEKVCGRPVAIDRCDYPARQSW